jgi:hypothetical protein
MVFIETDWIERATIEEALLRYCARDTLAMVELRRALKEKAQMKGAGGTDPFTLRGEVSDGHDDETVGTS